MSEDIKKQVLHIVKQLEEGVTFEYCGMNAEEYDREPEDIISGLDYLEDALDIQYIVNGEGEYLGARVLVAFGGPNIWIDTLNERVEGAWWGDKYNAHYVNDDMDINEALRMLWECSGQQ